MYMTSLPMSSGWPELSAYLNSTLTAGLPAGTPNGGEAADPARPADPSQSSDSARPAEQDTQFLLRAFRSFSQAASSLEHSYALLRAEVTRLRGELEASHAGLARSLEENRAMRAHLDRILESLPCGVLVISGKEISRANPVARRLLGLEDEPSGATESSSLDAISIAALPEAVGQLLASAREKDEEQELAIGDRGLPMRWLTARHAAIAGDGSGTSVFILRDVSERKRLEAAQDKLRREQALSEMSTVLAHEMRNPLGSLELFAGLLADSALDPECRKWVEQVQAGLRTLAATVNNVLQFHSLPEPDRLPLDLGLWLERARDFFAPLTRQARVVLRLQNGLAEVMFPSDRHRLEQVLANLILNAVRALPGGGWIRIAGRIVESDPTRGDDPGDRVRSAVVAVSDTGPGISPEHLPHIFEPGYTTRAGSPGLGLAVCRKIVEQHAGTLVAHSRPGHGATFTLTFPLDPAPLTSLATSLGTSKVEEKIEGAAS
jgi:two-component system sensor histidine kinase FlrB